MKTKLCTAILMLAAAVAFAGCSTPAMRIKANPELFATLAPDAQELIKQGQIAIGFTPDMVRLALGKPDITSLRTDASGTTEIWRWQNVDTTSSAFYHTDWGLGWVGSRYYRGYRWGGGWNAPFWGWDPPPTDYLRVTFANGRVTEIERLR